VFSLIIPIVFFEFIHAVMLDVLAYVPRDPFQQLTLSLCILGLFLATIFVFALKPRSKGEAAPNSVEAYLKFIYGCFLKPHTGDGTGSQQDALVR
jgi:betaine lipid synthase